MTPPRRVLVTGASGCIGRALVPRLIDAGWQVHAVVRRLAADRDPRVAWHAGDLLEPGTPARVVADARADALIHLAWYIAPGRWAAAIDNVDWLRASLDLVRAFAAAGGGRFVGAGSGLEYDWAHGYCTEALTPCRPHTLYGTTKLALYSVLEGLAAHSDLSCAWARVFFLYGPHEHPDRLVAAVIRALLAGDDAHVSHGRQVRDYLHVDDVASALMRLLESDEAVGAFNVCSGAPVTLRAIVEEIGAQLGAGDRLRFGAVPAAATDMPLVVGNPGRLMAGVGWRPDVSLADGLARTIAWWREQPAVPRSAS